MTLSRRSFLTSISAGSLVASTASAGGIHKFPAHPNSLGLLHDTVLCVGCRECELACQRVNQLPLSVHDPDDETLFGTERLITDKAYTVVRRYPDPTGKRPFLYRKHQCMHCLEPCCASVCFVKAFEKTMLGPVAYDESVCVGCRYCLFACAYSALAYEYDNPLTPRVVRCTLCKPRLEEGKIPACAESCPMGAITFGKRETLLQIARERIHKRPQDYVNHIFGEHEFGGSSWLTLAGVPFERLGLPSQVTHTPLGELTTGFLSLAPLVSAIFPGLLAGFYAFAKRKDTLSELEKRAAVKEAKRILEAIQPPHKIPTNTKPIVDKENHND